MRKLYISLFLNTFILASVIVCLYFSFRGGFDSIKMFTVQSNTLSGIVALIIIVYEILIILKKKKELPTWLLTLKMVTSTAVALTLIIVVFFLGFVAVAEGYSYFILFRGTNICFHFLTPLAAIISFTFFENTNKIKFKYTFFNIIHMVLYTNFYVTNVILELIFDKSVGRYDWYYFFATGNNFISGLILCGGLALTYFIGFGMWIGNKKLAEKNNNLREE